ncbi:hypothetical protein BGZ54_006733 [Gamsiella multidivaricata]|nr:hypothetical protein BGZ54_006733 [Gamsiella multidivaricata]
MNDISMESQNTGDNGDHGTDITNTPNTTSQKVDPTAIPEILLNVLSFLDRDSLCASSRVSRTWRSLALLIAWQICHISSEIFCIAFQERDRDWYKRQEDEARRHNTNSWWRNHWDDKDYVKCVSKFLKNCFRIRSLTIASKEAGHKWPLYAGYPGEQAKAVAKGDSSKPAVYRHPPGLDNLVHLRLQASYPEAETMDRQELLYNLATSLAGRNPGLRDLEVEDVSSRWSEEGGSIYSLLAKTGGSLERLSISCIFRGRELYLLEYLLSSCDDYHCRCSDEECDSAYPCMEHGPYNLKELILDNMCGSWLSERERLDWTALDLLDGTLSIRSLSVLEYETATARPEEFDEETEQLTDYLPESSILAILRLCPDLERLRVSYKLLETLQATPGKGRFRAQALEVIDRPRTQHWWIPERDNFVTEMFRLCPNLTTIDFGMMYELTTEHWVEMMELYGPKLQSLSVWCAINFSSDALTTLIGPPIDHPSRALNGPSAMHCLTQLDINGLAMAHSAAPLVLRNLAALTHFFARDVPMDATQLIGFDWACTKLEVLHICVVLCQERQPKGKEWSWDDESGEWTTALQRRRKQQEHAVGHKREREVMQPLNVDSAENAEGNKNQPQNEMEAEAEAKRRRVEKQAKHENAAEEHGQELSGLQGQGSQSAAENSELTTETRLQIQICKQLGRLTKLRQLVLEGDKGHMDSTGCLQLTMQTGLSYLQPLQQSLETLILYRLDEQLSGRAEVDWIARNWIHHHNKRWLHAHPPLEYNQDEDEDFDSDEDEESDDSEEWADFDPSCHEPPEEDTLIYATERVNIRGASDKSEEDDDKSLYTCPPKFKQLLGVSVRDQRYSVKTAVANLTWLKNQWPSLVLTKKRKPISRNYYDSDESYSD